MWLNDKQYEALLMLYNNFHDAFLALPDYMKAAFFERLHAKG